MVPVISWPGENVAYLQACVNDQTPHNRLLGITSESHHILLYDSDPLRNIAKQFKLLSRAGNTT